MSKVYACFCTDIIHEGHLNILKEANKYGDVIVGILSDRAMIKYNRFPTISMEERKKIVEETGLVSEVTVQDEIMYDTIIGRLKPDYVIHGDNWCKGPESAIRINVIKNLNRYGGKLIEVGYTYNENVKKSMII